MILISGRAKKTAEATLINHPSRQLLIFYRRPDKTPGQQSKTREVKYMNKNAIKSLVMSLSLHPLMPVNLAREPKIKN